MATTLTKKGDWSSGAEFSPCMTYRYALWRAWNKNVISMVVIGLNPSTADHVNNDATIRKCIGFAKREGCGGLVMLNLFGLRNRFPSALLNAADPVGPANDECIRYHVQANYGGTGGLYPVAAWGAHRAAVGRSREVVAMLGRRKAKAVLYCLGATKDGHPRHPLYLPNASKFIVWPGYPEIVDLTSSSV